MTLSMVNEKAQRDTEKLLVTVTGSFPPQGQGIPDYCCELVLALAEFCEVTALGYARMYPGFFFPGDAKSSIDNTRNVMDADNLSVRHSLTWFNPFGWIAEALFLRTDVFHVQHWSLPLVPINFIMLLLMKLRRKKTIVTVHNVLPHEKSSFFVLGSRLLCTLADEVLVHSEKNRQQLIESYHLTGKKIHKISMGATTHSVELIEKKKARAELNISVDDKVVLLIGHLRKYKGIDLLIKAFRMVTEKEEKVRLVIAGTPWIEWGPYENLIEEMDIREYVDVHLGYVPANEICYYYCAADIVVLPYTHFDAQSAIGAQILPYRKPMLVSDVGALPQWVGNNDRWIVPPGNVEELGARLIDFFKHHEEQTRQFEVIADEVIDKLSWDDIADQHVQIYKSVSPKDL